MRRALYIGFWRTVLGTLAFFILSAYEKIERLEMRVTGYIRTDHVDQIWFSPGGELVGVGRNESQFIVCVWHGSAGASLEGLERDLANLSLPAPKRKNYALVPMTGGDWKAAAERLRDRYAIEPLTYAPSAAEHPEVVDFLTRLNVLVRQKTSTQSHSKAAK